MVTRLTCLQQELLRALLSSGLKKHTILEALGEIEAFRAKPGESEEGDGVEPRMGEEESSEDGEEFEPPIFKELEALCPEEAAQQRALVDHLLQEDPWHVAKVIKSYMQQHNLPQREVVDATGLNQSHLSQHLNKGTPMKNQKRAALYTWYVRKQGEITQQFTNASRGILGEEPNDDMTSKKARRNRFKWGPASQQILFQAYERQKNPSKEEREVLVEDCNRAECIQRGVSPSQVQGLGSNLVTEVRVYNWFANRRKEEAFRHKLAMDSYSGQPAHNTPQVTGHSGHNLQASPPHGGRYSQQSSSSILTSTSAHMSGLQSTQVIVQSPSPTGLQPSHTLMVSDSKEVTLGSLPPVSTLTALHGLSSPTAQPQTQTPGLIMASLPSIMTISPGDSSLVIGLASSQAQNVPVINTVASSLTTLQPVPFQQHLTSAHQQQVIPPFQSNMTQGSFMTSLQPAHGGSEVGKGAVLFGGIPVHPLKPAHVYNHKSELSQDIPNSLFTQTMVITETGQLGAFTNLTAVKQVLPSDSDSQTAMSIQPPDSPTPVGQLSSSDSLQHLDSGSSVSAPSSSLVMYLTSQSIDSHPHLLSPSAFIPTQIASPTQ
ncbi:hepatocyte nuclear factor 1-alpha isoform X1 [Polypterus senegalus]|uniref:hepatocyte nuclear factor 1-alpha isoform X1 n=2 Tax=Polypterus senegalus TaxID=55291 RepID=UPI0019657E83|nr:hepatocyte nuclear factor 1-alpha isoform X1 [Polypterus senegalus]